MIHFLGTFHASNSCISLDMVPVKSQVSSISYIDVPFQESMKY